MTPMTSELPVVTAQTSGVRPTLSVWMRPSFTSTGLSSFRMASRHSGLFLRAAQCKASNPIEDGEEVGDEEDEEDDEDDEDDEDEGMMMGSLGKCFLKKLRMTLTASELPPAMARMRGVRPTSSFRRRLFFASSGPSASRRAPRQRCLFLRAAQSRGVIFSKLSMAHAASRRDSARPRLRISSTTVFMIDDSSWWPSTTAWRTFLPPLYRVLRKTGGFFLERASLSLVSSPNQAQRRCSDSDVL